MVDYLNDLGVRYIVRRIRLPAGSLQDYGTKEREFLENSENERLLKSHIDMEIKVRDSRGQIETFKAPSDFLNLHEVHGFRGWHCQAGVEALTIWSDGRLLRCEAGLKSQESLGNIFDKAFAPVQISPTICPARWCVCSHDMLTTKSKN
jgi:hypothetical protein